MARYLRLSSSPLLIFGGRFLLGLSMDQAQSLSFSTESSRRQFRSVPPWRGRHLLLFTSSVFSSLLRTCEYCVSLRTCGEGTPPSSNGGLRGFGHGEENDYNDDDEEQEEEEEEV